jgi:hypothetical protein
MKRNLLTFVFVLTFTFQCFPVEKTTVDDDGAVTKDGKEDIRCLSCIMLDGSPYNFIFSWKRHDMKSHWTGFGFAFSALGGLDGDVDIDLSHSYSVVLNVCDYTVPLSRKWLLTAGLGFDWSRYHFRGNTGLQSVGGKTVFVTDGREYRDSKLLFYSATVPLLLEYQTRINKRKTFFVYGGVEGLVKLYSKSQVEIRTPKSRETYGGLHLLPLNFRLAGRIGFDKFSVFGYYQPLSMFENGKGPDIHPYGLGLMLKF